MLTGKFRDYNPGVEKQSEQEFPAASGAGSEESVSDWPVPGFEAAASDCLKRAFQIAQCLNHISISADHLMLALTLEQQARNLLVREGDIDSLREAAMQRLAGHVCRDASVRVAFSKTSDLHDLLKAARDAAAERGQLVSISDLVCAFPRQDGRLAYGSAMRSSSLHLIETIEKGLLPRLDAAVARIEDAIRRSYQSLQLVLENQSPGSEQRQRDFIEEIRQQVREAVNSQYSSALKELDKVDAKIAELSRVLSAQHCELPLSDAVAGSSASSPMLRRSYWSWLDGAPEEAQEQEQSTLQLQSRRSAARVTVTRRKRGKRADPLPHISSADKSEETPTPPRPPSDEVDFSVFGPKQLKSGGESLIQVFLHTLSQREIVRLLAEEGDPQASRRGVKTLATEIRRGQLVQVLLEGDGLESNEKFSTLVWRGEPCSCEFRVRAREDWSDRAVHPRVLVLVDSVPVGSLTFAIQIAAGTSEPGLLGDGARHYSYAFLSYDRADQEEVVKRAQGLKAAGIDFFADILALRAGERWEDRIYAAIDDCDLFCLFWSSRARDSEWVMRETTHALKRRALSEEGIPDIVPIIIEGPPPPPPPEQFKGIHFDDSLIYVLAGMKLGESREALPN